MNKILIADSGSTKTHWILANKEDKKDFYCSGINPYFMNSPDIVELVDSTFLGINKDEVSSIYFYGAGCSNKEKCTLVKNALQYSFPKANVFVAEDLLASARALLGNKAGVACIIGTGSNAAVFDGENFTSQIDSLGHLLGDEASGAVIGRQLVIDYYRKVMPNELRTKFENDFDISLSNVLEKVYKEEFPNRYLASFAPFASKNIENEYINNLMNFIFDEFIEYQLGVINFNKDKMEIGFVGSIAYYFQDNLKDRLITKGYKIGKIIKAPIKDLVEYHINLN